MITFIQRILWAGLLFYSQGAAAQQFGGTPPSQKWYEVNSPLSRVVFHQGLDSQAKHISAIIEILDRDGLKTIGDAKRKINVVLQNQTTISNAYVGLGPFRSEFYLTPSPNSFELGSLPWYEQLVIHEYRHVQQDNNFNVGLSKAFRFFFGEEGQSLANNAAIPNWFYEGDAVYNETIMSNQGRGRIPFFFNGYHSLWAGNKNYNWMKLRNGSYKDFVPDHYPLGYLLVAYGRDKYGEEFWKKVTHDAAAFKGLIYPFQKAIKTYAGISYRQFRSDALNYFKSPYLEKAKTVTVNEAFRDEEYPAFTSTGELIMSKGSFKTITSFVSRDSSGDRKIRARDVSLDNQFSFRNDKVVYTAYQPDTRWSWRDYSDLRLLDLNTGEQHSLTYKAKYFSPDIKDDGKQIVAVAVPDTGNSSLHILDATDGHLIHSIPNPQQFYYTFPKFYNNKQIVSAVRNMKGEMSLALIDIENGNSTLLTPFSYEVIGFPAVSNDTIYFSGSRDSKDRLFAFTLQDHKTWQLDNPQMNEGTGNYQPAAGNGRFAWTNFTASGYRVKEVPLAEIRFLPVNIEQEPKAIVNNGVQSIDGKSMDLAAFPAGNKSVGKYNKSYRLVNFHSIEPLINDPEYTLTFISENILNTLSAQVSGTYNRDERSKRVGVNAVYGGWFPYINAGLNYTMDRRGLYHGNRIFFNELESSAGLSVPLNFSKGRNMSYVTVSSLFVNNRTDFTGHYKDSLKSYSYGYLNNSIIFSTQIQQAKQQIYPHLAASLVLNYKTAITSFKGSQFLAAANFYLPGIGKTHSLVLTAAVQQHDTINQLRFSNSFPFSRGYTVENLYHMFKAGINYHFPLAYPDAGFGNIVYLSRIRANLFYDYTHVQDFYTNRTKFLADFRSTGAEFYFDTRWWNQLPATIGIRYTHLLDNDLFGGRTPDRFEIILPVNLYQR